MLGYNSSVYKLMEIILMHCCSLLIASNDFVRASWEATDGKDSYASLALGNWNYYDALRFEKIGPKLEATHLEKTKELYIKVHYVNQKAYIISKCIKGASESSFFSII
ncbi:hypothetical protein Scep_007318 [Stephania cephalantha]|uniref:Uncharacterized protein n=1 Tax=Stephania cephalantha TaxID=152367 RepID=A0AAP0K9R9_9MAGN